MGLFLLLSECPTFTRTAKRASGQCTVLTHYLRWTPAVEIGHAGEVSSFIFPLFFILVGCFFSCGMVCFIIVVGFRQFAESDLPGGK